VAQNFVQIKIKASDTAKPDLTDLRAQLADIGRQVETAKVDVNDTDGKARLLDMNAKLAALNAKVANPKISLAGATRAQAQIALLDAQLRKSSDDSTTAKTRFGALGGVINALTLGLSGGVGEMSMFQKVMLGLNIATGLGEPLVAGLAVAVGGLAAGLVSAGSAAGAFGLLAKANLTAASTAATAANAAQTRYTSAVTAANAAYSRAMASATTATARKNAETARASALQSAYKAQVQATTAAYANLTPAQVALSKQVGAIQGQWQKFTASFAGPTSVIVAQLRPLVTSVLPDIRKLALAGETGLSSMLSVLGSKGSGGLDKFVSMMADEAPAAIMRLGVAIGHIVTGIGGILRAFMPVSTGLLSGLDNITARFAKWGQTLSGHSGFQSLMTMFRQETPLAVSALKQLAALIKTVVASMAGMSTFSNSASLLKMLDLLLPALNKLAKVPGLVQLILYLKLASDAGSKLKTVFSGIGSAVGVFKSGASAFQDLSAGFTNSAAAASSATGVWGTLGGKLSSVGSALSSAASSVASFAAQVVQQLGRAAVATGAWIAEHAVAAASFIAENVAMAASATAAFIAENLATLGIIAGIALLVTAVIYLATHWRQVWGVVKKLAVDAFHILVAALKAFIAPWVAGFHLAQDVVRVVMSFIRDWINVQVDEVKVILSWFGRLGGLFRGWWDDAVHAVTGAVARMIQFVSTIPGKIMSTLSSLPGKLFSLGSHIISMLASGIRSAIGDVTHAIGSVVGEITSHLPFSPAKKGPLSGSGSPDKAGSRIARMLAQGMASGTSAVTEAAARMAGAAGIGGRPVIAGAGTAGMLRLQVGLEVTGADSLLLKWIRSQVRVHGGGGPDSVQKAFGRTS
jgi:hypothetical protein